MAESNGNGFKVAFWVMATISVVGLMTLVQYVVANDQKSLERYEKNRDRIEELLKDNNSAHTMIIENLMQIKTTLGIRK